jgi:hypothetical protein
MLTALATEQTARNMNRIGTVGSGHVCAYSAGRKRHVTVTVTFMQTCHSVTMVRI